MKQPIYLDYAATTPVDPAVAEKMVACLTMDGNFANPASRSSASSPRGLGLAAGGGSHTRHGPEHATPVGAHAFPRGGKGGEARDT